MNNKKIDKVLITGVTGLLGSWMAEKMLNENIQISGIAIDKSKDDLLKTKGIYEKISIEYFDISNELALSEYFKNNQFDIVFHLAAQTQVIDANLNPLHTFNSNIKGTWNVLNECLKKDVPVVVASSDKAYGVSSKLPYLESHELNGVYPYEVSKSITDMLVKSYHQTYNLNVVSLRCGNIYGGGDLNWDRLIPGVCKWLFNNEQPILRTDGSFKRDWVYVEDVVDAYIQVGSSLYNRDKKISLAYNFAAESYKTVIEVYNEVSENITGRIIDPIYKIDSETEIPDQYLDSKKIRDELNVKSKVRLSEGIELTVNWYRDYFLK
jgi:CDP-glucose 4,6-dehydratase